MHTVIGAAVGFLVLFAAVTGVLRWAGTRGGLRTVRGGRPGASRSRRDKSWLVTAAKAAGMKINSDQLGGASAELTGKAAGGLTRTSGRLARRGGHRLAAVSGRRWLARGDSVRRPLFLTRIKNDSDSNRDSNSDSDRDSNSDTPSDRGAAADTRPAAAAAAAPAGTSQQVPAPAGTGADPAPAATPTPIRRTAPAGARRENTQMRHRYAVNLERPSTDAEFLESTVQLGDVLKSLAGEVSDWADGLSGLNLPQSVLNPLRMVGDGIEEAATGAAQSAKAFEDEFEDARDVASRGMKFTGEEGLWDIG